MRLTWIIPVSGFAPAAAGCDQGKIGLEDALFLSGQQGAACHAGRNRSGKTASPISQTQVAKPHFRESQGAIVSSSENRW
jgi:hypothetical protein